MRGLGLKNYFVKKKKRKKEKGSSGKKLGVFSARYSNYTFNRKFNSKMDKIKGFFKSWYFFDFQKRAGRP